MTGQGAEHKNVRKQRVIRRIQEYKKFRSNCQRLREFIKEKHQLRQNVLVSHKVKTLSVGGRSKSEEALLRRGVKNDRLMGRLCVSSPNLSRDLSLEEAIYLWRLKRDRQQQQPGRGIVTNNKFIFAIFPFLLVGSINIGKRKSSVPQFSFNLRL